MGLQCRRAWGIYLTAEQINPKSASDKPRKWEKDVKKCSEANLGKVSSASVSSGRFSGRFIYFVFV